MRIKLILLCFFTPEYGIFVEHDYGMKRESEREKMAQKEKFTHLFYGLASYPSPSFLQPGTELLFEIERGNLGVYIPREWNNY